MTKIATAVTALSPEALLGKSKLYISRALAAKSRDELGEYQLWASLSLELLGKSALAQLHPCLVADPNSYVSMFAAAGITVGSDIKTIIAKTLFERLTHISKRFDKKTQDFCTNMSLKRNSELHSGEAPFEAVIPGSWEGRFWHTVEIILEARGNTIEEWIGAGEAKAPKQLLAEYTHAIVESAKIKVETAKEAFNELPKKDREAALSKAALLEPRVMRRMFDAAVDNVWATKCPSCSSKSFLGGYQSYEEVSEDREDDPWEETVDVYYDAEEFHCPTCNLMLDNREAIDAVGLPLEHEEQEVRQREYEPEYGND